MKGLVLVNMGTPDAPNPAAVRRFLRELLSDPMVVDLPALPRRLLLELVILPFRPRKSAKAYCRIWSDRGSPLLVHGEGLAAGVAAALGKNWQVELAMRYGRPSIASALERLANARVNEARVLPLYPQDAPSTRGSTVTAVRAAAELLDITFPVRFLPVFFDRKGYLDAVVATAGPVVEQVAADHVLFSFHGLPERQIKKADPSGSHCLVAKECCKESVPANKKCYRFQCYQTARALASRMGLGPEDGRRWSVAFQSRMGRVPWIGPHIDEVLSSLARKGVERVGVVCPSFVADCLETLEEIGMRARLDFKARGGGELVLVPCLNSSPTWVEAVAKMALNEEDSWQ